MATTWTTGARAPDLPTARRTPAADMPGPCEDAVNVGDPGNPLEPRGVNPLVSTAPDTAEWVAPSWDEIVRQHSPRVFRLAYRLTGNKHDAEDLTQEVFVRVFRSLDSYTPGTFEGWIHRITTNLFLDLVRRRARIRFDALPDDAERVSSGERTPAERYDDGLFDADVQSALDALPPEFRAAVVLCDIEGLSYEEIADVLDIKLGTVRSRIHRGRTALRTSLQHRARGPITGTGGAA
ncbi:MAG: polymerase sigma factor SigE [Frankiales bacterium]|nr:polymerase sigma factor SigE [Frankiales bacterium]